VQILNKESVVIIIPTYNESLIIEETVHQVMQEIERLEDFDVSLLIFDSASTDGTQEKVKALQALYPQKIFLEAEPEKTGLGSAYLQAMRFAFNTLKADIIVEFDADLSHQPKYLPHLLKALNDNDVAIGSRYIRGGSIPQNWGLHRKFLSVLGNMVARCILSFQYKDFTSGFRATRRRVLFHVLPDRFLSNHYAYKLHLLWILHQHQARIVEVPIEFVDREKGVSKLPANSIIDSLRVILTLRLADIKRRTLNS
jgi:dolichol-phosphate mannosyltransferase